jgi:hypothetical protein
VEVGDFFQNPPPEVQPMGILDEMKGVADAVHEVKNLELYERILNVRSDAVELVEENHKLREENKKLKELVEVKKKMIHKPPFFFQEGDKTPFCPACWEGHEKTVHLQFGFEDADRIRWECPHCKHSVLIRKNNPRPPTAYSDPDSWAR